VSAGAAHRGDEREEQVGVLPPDDDVDDLGGPHVDVADEPLRGLGRHLNRRPDPPLIDERVLPEVFEAAGRPLHAGAGVADGGGTSDGPWSR
jgi:hypothetical protein